MKRDYAQKYSKIKFSFMSVCYIGPQNIPPAPYICVQATTRAVSGELLMAAYVVSICSFEAIYTDATSAAVVVAAVLVEM